MRYLLLQWQSDLDLLNKAIAIHTFLVVMWGSGTHPYFTAYVIVSFTWLFLVVFIAITVVPNTHSPNFYETPVGVSLLLYIMSHLIYGFIVLMLDWQPAQNGTIYRSICMGVADDVRVLPHLHDIVLLGTG